MGVVNVTPDSFSDGGRWATPDAAIAHGRELLRRRRRHPRRRRRVDPPRRHPAAGRRGARPRRPGDRRPRGATAPPSRSTPCAARWPLAAVEAGAADRQRRLRRPRRPADARRWSPRAGRRTSPCTGAPTATPCSSTRRTTARATSSRRCATSWPSGSRRCSPPASGRSGSCSTPGSASPRPPSTTGPCCAGSSPIADLGLPGAGRRVAASRSSGSLLAGPDGVARGVEDREHASSALHVLLAQEGVWGLRTHDVRAAHDALRALARWNRTPSMTEATA